MVFKHDTVSVRRNRVFRERSLNVLIHQVPSTTNINS